MRKFFILLAVVAILASMALPAFAAEEEYDWVMSYGPSISFDSISGSMYPDKCYPWPFTRFSDDLLDHQFDFDFNFYGSYALSPDGTEFNSDFVFAYGASPDLSYLTLSSSKVQIVNRSTLDGSVEFFGLDNTVRITSVRVFGWLSKIRLNDRAGVEVYDLDPVEMDYLATCSDGICRLGDILNDAISSTVQFISNDLVAIDNLHVEINFVRLSNATPKFCFSGKMMPCLDHLSEWFYEFDCPREVIINAADFNITSWLRDSLGAFFKFEIAPGFSLDSIFYIVLVVGVLLWFIKMIV